MEGNLCLSRKVGQSVQLMAPGGKPITVTVESIDRGKVRLVFRADRDVAIVRSELIDMEEKA